MDHHGVQNFSLSQLKSFKPDYLKFGWGELSPNRDTSSTLAASQIFKLLGFFKSLDIAIISKNVESKAQSLALLKHGVVMQQGHYYGRATDLETFIADWSNPESVDKAS